MSLRTAQTNYLTHMLLTIELLPFIAKAPAPRVVYTSSWAATGPSSSWRATPSTVHGDYLADNFGVWGQRHAKGMSRYGECKLVQLLGMRALQRALDGAPQYRHVILHATHPGVVLSGMVDKDHGLPSWLQWLLKRLMTLFAISPAEGAMTNIVAGASDDAGDQDKKGSFWTSCTRTQMPERAMDDEARDEVWAISLRDLGLSTEWKP